MNRVSPIARRILLWELVIVVTFNSVSVLGHTSEPDRTGVFTQTYYDYRRESMDEVFEVEYEVDEAPSVSIGDTFNHAFDDSVLTFLGGIETVYLDMGDVQVAVSYINYTRIHIRLNSSMVCQVEWLISTSHREVYGEAIFNRDIVTIVSTEITPIPSDWDWRTPPEEQETEKKVSFWDTEAGWFLIGMASMLAVVAGAYGVRSGAGGPEKPQSSSPTAEKEKEK